MADNVEMQGLEFQIVNDSTQAVKGLEKLSKTLESLKSATRGGISGVSSAVRAIERLSTALSNMNASETGQKVAAIRAAITSLQGLKGVTIPKALTARLTELNTTLSGMSVENINKLTGFGTGLNALSQVGNVRISSSIANQLTAIGAAVTKIQFTDGDKLTDLANGLRPLSELGKANMTTFINQLGKLPTVIEELDNANLDKFINQMNRLAAVMKPFADEMQKVSDGFSAFPSQIQKLITSTEKYNGTTQKATARTKAWGSALSKIKSMISTFITTKLGINVGQSLLEASEWEGIAARFGRAMGESAQENYEWIKRLNSEMKINVQQFMQYSSIFGTMLKGYGVATEDAAKMAMNYTELTYDIWAGYNDIYKSFEDAAIAVRSAIAGEVEPIRKAGFTIVDSQLKITAANYGIAYSSQTASEELKSYLRYLTMIDQAKVQGLIGTYAKELNTAEGLIRTLRQQIASLAQTLGSLLLPALVKILPYIQAFVQLIIEAISALATLFGVDLQPVSFEGISAGAGAAKDMAAGLNNAAGAAKKLKHTVMGFDELNIINTQSGGGSSGGVGGGSYDGMFDIDKVWDEEIFKNINDQVDDLKEKLKELLPAIEAIGTAILAWKIAKKFTDDLETLLGVASIAAGLVIGIENIEAILSGEYENTSVESAIKTALSGLLVGTGAVLLGASGWVIPITVALSFLITSIVVNWDKTVDMWKGIGEAIGGILHGDSEQKWGGIDQAFSSWLNMDAWTMKLVGGITDLLLGDGYFDTLKHFFADGGSWKDILDKCGENISRFFSSLWGAIKRFFKKIGEKIAMFFNGIWLDIQGIWYDASTWFNENVIQPIVEFFKGLWEDVSGFFEGLWEGIKDVWNSVANWFNENVIQPIVKFFKGLWEDVSGFFKGLWNDVEEVWNTVANWFNEKVIQPIVEFFTGLKEDISDAFTDAWDNVKKVWDTVANWFDLHVISPIKKALNALGFGGGKVTVTTSGGSVGKFASGGFPDEGQLFIAREAGAEMVGAINNRAAVANNDQIVEAVAMGVYDAVSHAMAEGENNMIINLDGEVLYRAIVKRDRQTVKRTGSSAFAY